jgi:hypothetical protein
MSSPKIIKRLVACFGTIQLITALSVLSYRKKEQQELNVKYEDYLVITPLWAPQGQTNEFVAFIEKMARSTCSWEKIVYISYEQIMLITKTLNSFNVSKVYSLIREQIGIENPNEIYLSREWRPENQILMDIYKSAEKICYGDGIGLYFSQSAFPSPSSLQNSHVSLKTRYASLKKKLKALVLQKRALTSQEFDIGYFSLPYAYGEIPPMKTVVLDKIVYLETFQRFRETLGSLIDINYVNKLRTNIQDAPTSILLTSNFSEAAGRMSLENEIAAYREFLETQGVPPNSVLLIKPHPRDSKLKIRKLQSALSDLYLDIIVLSEEFLFYLPFELLFMEVFLNPDSTKIQTPRIFTFSSACLTLELILNAKCTLGFGSDIVNKFFYEEHITSRIKHETDLQSTIREIKLLDCAL